MDQKEITYLFNEKKSIEVVCEFCKTKRVYRTRFEIAIFSKMML